MSFPSGISLLPNHLKRFPLRNLTCGFCLGDWTVVMMTVEEVAPPVAGLHQDHLLTILFMRPSPASETLARWRRLWTLHTWVLVNVLCCAWLVSFVQLFATPMNCSPPGFSVHRDSPGKNTGVGCHALLQGNFPKPGIEPRSPTL